MELSSLLLYWILGPKSGCTKTFMEGRTATNHSSTNTWYHHGHPGPKALSSNLVHVRSPATTHRPITPRTVRSISTPYPEPITWIHQNEYSSSRTRHSPQTETPLTSNHTGGRRRHRPSADLPSLILTYDTSIFLTLSNSSTYCYSSSSLPILSAPQSSVVVERWLTHPCGSLPTGEVGVFGYEATDDTFSLGVMVIKVSNRGFDPCE